MVNDLIKKAQDVVEENASAILTAVGVVGTVSTAVLTGRACFQASNVLADPDNRQVLTPEGDSHRPITRQEQLKLVWALYIPPVGAGAVTITSIILANRMSASKAAALAAAYGVKDKAFQEYRDKVQEKLTGKKQEEVREEIAQDRVNANPPGNLIIVGTGEVLCYDVLTDRYFQSTVEKIRQAEVAVNLEITQNDEVSLSRFYEEIGLKVTPYSETVGWNANRTCRVEFSTVMTDDNRPCIAVDFSQYPEISYHKVWD